MFDIVAMIWLIIGGMLEPIWLLALKRSDNFKNIGYSVLAVVAMIASPYCLSIAMVDIPVGTAYAIWTGLGGVGAVGTGYIFFKEKIDLKTVLFITMILIGVVGLAALGGE